MSARAAERPLVVLAGDEDDARPLSVAVDSLVRTTPASFDLVVVDVGLRSDSRAAIRRLAGDHDLRFVPPPEGWLEQFPTIRLPAATWCRLLVTRFADDACERVVFLDTDVLVRRSIEELFTLDLGGATLGAVRETGVGAAATLAGERSMPSWRRVGLAPAAPTFNAGVLVVDRRAWDERRATERVVALTADPDVLPCSSDQGYLNLALWREWQPLPWTWNSRLPGAAITHFLGPLKPWRGLRLPVEPYSAYFEAAARTGWDLGGRRRLHARYRLHQLAAQALPAAVLERRRRGLAGPLDATNGQVRRDSPSSSSAC